LITFGRPFAPYPEAAHQALEAPELNLLPTVPQVSCPEAAFSSVQLMPDNVPSKPVYAMTSDPVHWTLSIHPQSSPALTYSSFS